MREILLGLPATLAIVALVYFYPVEAFIVFFSFVMLLCAGTLSWLIGSGIFAVLYRRNRRIETKQDVELDHIDEILRELDRLESNRAK